jgi:hypothetical protein
MAQTSLRPNNQGSALEPVEGPFASLSTAMATPESLIEAARHSPLAAMFLEYSDNLMGTQKSGEKIRQEINRRDSLIKNAVYMGFIASYFDMLRREGLQILAQKEAMQDLFREHLGDKKELARVAQHVRDLNAAIAMHLDPPKKMDPFTIQIDLRGAMIQARLPLLREYAFYEREIKKLERARDAEIFEARTEKSERVLGAAKRFSSKIEERIREESDPEKRAELEAAKQEVDEIIETYSERLEAIKQAPPNVAAAEKLDAELAQAIEEIVQDTRVPEEDRQALADENQQITADCEENIKAITEKYEAQIGELRDLQQACAGEIRELYHDVADLLDLNAKKFDLTEDKAIAEKIDDFKSYAHGITDFKDPEHPLALLDKLDEIKEAVVDAGFDEVNDILSGLDQIGAMLEGIVQVEEELGVEDSLDEVLGLVEDLIPLTDDVDLKDCLLNIKRIMDAAVDNGIESLQEDNLGTELVEDLNVLLSDGYEAPNILKIAELIGQIPGVDATEIETPPTNLQSHGASS